MFEELAGRTPGCMDQKRYGQYAVIAPYLPEKEAFLFEVRASSLKHQPGEVSFPGGHIEKGETARQAALRETAEELLVDAGAVDIIAPLDIYTAPYSIQIHPFLAKLSGYGGTFQPAEVQKVFTVPFSFFLENQPTVYPVAVQMCPPEDFPYHLVGGKPYPWRQASYPVLFYRCAGHVIWGITAAIMHHIVSLYRAAHGKNAPDETAPL